MAFVSLLILTRICEWTFVDFTLFSSNEETECVKSAEIETKTTCQSDEGTFFFLVSNKFESKYFFRFQFIFHETPVHNSTIRRNRVKVKFLWSVRIPLHLPNWISVFLSPDCWLVNGFIVLVSHIVNNNSSVIKTCCQKRRRIWMPINTHDTCRQTFILVFWISHIFQRPD